MFPKRIYLHYVIQTGGGLQDTYCYLNLSSCLKMLIFNVYSSHIVLIIPNFQSHCQDGIWKCSICYLVHTCMLSHSVISNSLWSRGLKPARLLGPWDSPEKNTGASCHFLLQGIFPTTGLNPQLLHLLRCWANSLPLSHLGRHIWCTLGSW